MDQDRSSWVEAVHSCAIAVVVVVAAAGVQMMEFVPAAEEVQMTAEVEEVEEQHLVLRALNSPVDLVIPQGISLLEEEEVVVVEED